MHLADRLPVPATRARGSGRWHVPVVAILAAAGLLLSTLAPAWAANPTRLFDPSVRPRLGTTATTIELSVAYRDSDGSPAEWVRVQIGDLTKTMTKEAAPTGNSA